MGNTADKIKNLLGEAGVGFKENQRTFYTQCPMCLRSDKFSILKDSGRCVCYRGSCAFGKRRFTDWLALTLNISESEAKEKFFNIENLERPEEELVLDLKDNFSEKETKIDIGNEIAFPEFGMMPITVPEADEGAKYLEGRGVPIDIQAKYELYYTPVFRRVVFPIRIDKGIFGYQARAIDKVSPDQRMRNNTGFRRDSLVMFLNNLKDSDHAIICEGPVNAIKFDRVGGAVCTMGKVVTNKQLDLILSHGIKKVYLALDDDAAQEMLKLAKQINVPVFKLDVPESCRDRCLKLNKKPDFGECTFDECVEAFSRAKKLDETQVLIYLKK